MAEQRVEAIFDDKEVVAFFKSLKSNLKRIDNGEKKFVGMLSAIVLSDVMDHFNKEEGSAGPWEQWSPSYQQHMQKIGRAGNKILQFSGKLRQNFKPSTDYRNTSDGILWFNDAQTKGGFPYAAAHEEGGDQLPKRDFMWLSPDGAEKISKQTLQFMLDEGI